MANQINPELITAIPIPGRLVSVDINGQVTGANQVWDDQIEENQEIINSRLNERITNIEQGVVINLDNELSLESENAVQNKVITEALNEKLDIDDADTIISTKVQKAISEIDCCEDGKSAYEIARDNGYQGTEQEWLQSLKGDPFTYSDFTPEQLASLKGPKGDNGQNGTNGTNGTNGRDGTDGKSAYQSYLDTTTDNPKKTEAQWVASLVGPQGEPGTVDTEVLQQLEQTISGLTTRLRELEEKVSRYHPDSDPLPVFATFRNLPTASDIEAAIGVGEKPVGEQTIDMTSLSGPTDMYIVYPLDWETIENELITSPIIKSSNDYETGFYPDEDTPTVVANGITYRISDINFGKDTYKIEFT